MLAGNTTLVHQKSKMLKIERTYLEAFILTLIFTFSPVKTAGVIAPYFILLWFMIRSGSGITFKNTTLFITLYLILIAFYTFFLKTVYDRQFMILNAVISLVTYSSLIFYFVVPSPNIRLNYDKYFNILTYVLVIEGVIGVIQYAFVKLFNFDMLAGDAVQGTIGLTAFLGQAGFGNQMFCINLSFILIFYIPYYFYKNPTKLRLLLVPITALLLAAVIHVQISLFIAFFVSLLMISKLSIKNYVRFTLIGGIITLTFFMLLTVALPGITTTASIYLSKYEEGSSPKLESVETVFSEVAYRYPYMYIFGTGPGQYSSRAGLISSGYYFGNDRVNALIRKTSFGNNFLFNENFKDLWFSYSEKSDKYGNSTVHRPFFSILSFIVEFGLLATLVTAIVLINRLYKCKRVLTKLNGPAINNSNDFDPRIPFAISWFLSVSFIICISSFENYLETSQAVFLGFLLMKLFNPIYIPSRR